MEILLGSIDADTIRIIRRWRSKETLCYIHVTARPLMQGYTANIAVNGGYALIPAETSPPSAVGTPTGLWETPRRTHVGKFWFWVEVKST